MSEWTGGRVPLEDPVAEEARKDAYWRWLADRAAEGELINMAPTVALSGFGRWVLLESADDADWEAFHMQHSVGHSWSRYSSWGPIYSARRNGIPHLTALVVDGAVVHAREQRNARPSPEAEAALAFFAAVMDLEVRPDPLPFDFFRNEGCRNTALRYVMRDAGGAKTFGEAVFAGLLPEEAGERLAAGLREGRYFDPAQAGLPSLGDGVHELMGVVDVAEEATDPRPVAEVAAALSADPAPRV